MLAAINSSAQAEVITLLGAFVCRICHRIPQNTYFKAALWIPKEQKNIKKARIPRVHRALLCSYVWKKCTYSWNLQGSTNRDTTPWLDRIYWKSGLNYSLDNRSSFQEAINEFIRAYGPIDETFSKDLFGAGSSLGFLLHETPNKANFKQLGLAHYSIGASRRVEKQLWCVPSGDGKSRIMIFDALLGLKTGMFKNVHLIYANKHLMERDKADFEDLWRLA